MTLPSFMIISRQIRKLWGGGWAESAHPQPYEILKSLACLVLSYDKQIWHKGRLRIFNGSTATLLSEEGWKPS